MTQPAVRFRNLSIGALALTATLAIAALLAVLVCAGFAFLYVFAPEPGPAAPRVQITKCNYADEDATVLFETTNTGKVRASYWLRFAVKDASGKVLGEAKGYVSTLDPGETAKDDVTIFYDEGSMGTSCEYVGVAG